MLQENSRQVEIGKEGVPHKKASTQKLWSEVL